MAMQREAVRKTVGGPAKTLYLPYKHADDLPPVVRFPSGRYELEGDTYVWHQE